MKKERENENAFKKKKLIVAQESSLSLDLFSSRTRTAAE